ncbi:MAG: hypothetical protein IJL20_03885, partial [Lachnospiraceae bacterium]|nr:hypothetical protein [Lachnospiraceae bacterium]
CPVENSMSEKWVFEKTCCPRRGITNCQCPKNRVSLNLDVYSMGYILGSLDKSAQTGANQSILKGFMK